MLGEPGGDSGEVELLVELLLAEADPLEGA